MRVDRELQRSPSMKGIVVVCALFISSIAHADDDKDPTVALVLSSAGTALPIAVLAVHEALPQDLRDADAVVGAIGVFVGPSIGHWYAGEAFDLGLGLRLGGVAVGYLGGAIATSGCSKPPMNECGLAAVYPVLAGLAMIGARTVYDIATAPRAARRHNQRAIGIAPTRAGSGYGLAVVGRF